MKKSKFLSALLAVSMLLTVFSATGMSATAITDTAPNAAYTMSETVIVEEALNRGATVSGNLAYSGTTYASHSVTGVGNTNYATDWKYTISSFETMCSASRLADSISAHGNLKTIEGFAQNLDNICVSFDLTVSSGFVDSEMRMEFRGYNSTEKTTSSSLGFSVALTEGTRHICIPLSSMAHFNSTAYSVSDWVNAECTGLDYVYLIFGSNQYSSTSTDGAWFEISNFSLVNVSYTLEKAETEKSLSGVGYSVSYAKNSATSLSLEKVNDFEISGSTYTGFRGTVSDVTKFNNNNTEVLYTFDETVDLTEDLENAKLSFWLHLGGSLAETETPKIRVALVTNTADGTEKNAYQNVTLTKTGDWQKVTLNLATDLPYGGVGITNCAIDNIVAVKFSNIGSGKYMQTDDTDDLTPDALEIADVKICKTVETPVNSAGIDLKFSSVSLALEDNLTMNFKADKALFDSKYSKPYAVIEGETVEGVLVGDKYVFSYENIAPQSIRDTVTATLYATYNGAVCEGKTTEYSIKKYCDTLLASTEDAATRTLLVDLLNYGSAAQSYVGKRVNNLANRNLTEEQVAWGTAEAAEVASYYQKGDETGKSVAWESVGLTLDDSVVVNFQFTAESKENLTVKITDGTDTLAEITGDDIVAVDEDSFRIGFDGLNAKGMRRLLYVTVQSGDEAVSSEVVYSVESYVTRVLSEDVMGDATADATLDALVTALMKYGDAAYAYAAR